MCLFSVVACYFFWWWLVDWLLSFLLTCSDIAAGIPLDKDHVIHFFCSCQLLVRELHKSYRLIQRKPLDMTSFYGEMLLSLEPNLNAKYTGTLATGRKLYKHEILIQFMSSRRQQQKKNSLGRGLDATRWNNFSAHPTEICLYNVCFFFFFVVVVVFDIRRIMRQNVRKFLVSPFPPSVLQSEVVFSSVYRNVYTNLFRDWIEYRRAGNMVYITRRTNLKNIYILHSAWCSTGSGRLWTRPQCCPAVKPLQTAVCTTAKEKHISLLYHYISNTTQLLYIKCILYQARSRSFAGPSGENKSQHPDPTTTIPAVQQLPYIRPALSRL